MPGPVRGKGRGHTLMELLVTLALAAMVAAWTVPALRDFWLGIKAGTASAHFMGELETMRFRSRALPQAVTICGSADGSHCDRDLGRLVLMFRDSNADGVADAGEELLYRDPFTDDEEFWLVWRSFQNKPYLRWAAGRTDSMNGTFTVCNRRQRDEWLRQVVVNRAGRSRQVVPLRAGASVLLAARKACGWG